MRHLCLLPLFALAACATVPPEPASAQPGASCRNDNLASFTGQPRSEALGRQILAASGARTIRWVEQGTMVTMEFREDRVTVHLDAANRVERAVCG